MDSIGGLDSLPRPSVIQRQTFTFYSLCVCALLYLKKDRFDCFGSIQRRRMEMRKTNFSLSL